MDKHELADLLIPKDVKDKLVTITHEFMDEVGLDESDIPAIQKFMGRLIKIHQDFMEHGKINVQ